MDEDVAWRWMLGIAAAPSVIQFFGFLVLPESPRWLVKKGKESLAKKVLKKLRGPHGVDQEFNAIKEDCEEIERKDKTEDSKLIIKKIILDANVRKALLVGS